MLLNISYRRWKDFFFKRFHEQTIWEIFIDNVLHAIFYNVFVKFSFLNILQRQNLWPTNGNLFKNISGSEQKLSNFETDCHTHTVSLSTGEQQPIFSVVPTSQCQKLVWPVTPGRHPEWPFYKVIPSSFGDVGLINFNKVYTSPSRICVLVRLTFLGPPIV